MKKISIVLFLFIVTNLLNISYSKAQNNTGLNQTSQQQSLLSQIAIKKHNSSWIQFRENKKINPSSVFQDYKKAFGLEKNDEMRVSRIETDKLEFTHYRYQQYYKGITIEGAEYLIHAKNGIAISGNGKIVKNLSLNNISQISSDQAVNIAINYVNADIYMWESKNTELILKKNKNNPDASFYPKAKLIIVDKKYSCIGKNYRLAYKVDVFAQKPMSRQYIYVDALTGDVFHTINRILNTDVTGIAETKYNGTQIIITDSVSPGLYRLRETSRGDGIETYDMNEGTEYGNAVDFTDDDNYWDVITNQDDAAYNAHWAAEMTYDYYFTKFGQSSFDGNGAKIISYVHYDQNYYNAFWNGEAVTYGDGDGSVTALTPLDICGHEISHAFTEYSADLIYQDESGALNESFSDIFGTCVEFYADTVNPDWTIGEDIGSAMRSMSDPKAYNDPDTYLGENWATGTMDYGGVHTNCGVQSHWFYLLSEGGSGTNDNGHSYNVTGLGIDTSAEIAYRNLHTYLISSSQYYDSRSGSIQAAEDLYGSCSNAVIETANAWNAVGVGYAFNDYDVSLLDVQSPITACGLLTEDVTVLLGYNGCNTSLNVGDTIFAGYNLDGDTTGVIDTIILSSPFNGGDTLIYIFNNAADVSGLGIHTIDCWVNFGLDSMSYNDTIYAYEFENKLQQNFDVGVIAVHSPTAGCNLSGSEIVEIELEFFICDSIPANDSIAVAYQVNGGSITRDTLVLSSAVYSNETINYTFNTTADFSDYGTYFINVWTEFDIDTLNDNDSLLGYEVKKPIALSNNIITFEDNVGVLDSFLITTNEQSDAYVSTGAANTGNYGFQMTGGNDPMSYMDILMNADTSNIWEDLKIFSSKAYFCVDATSWITANLRFDLEQTFSKVYEAYVGEPIPQASSLRILVNDNEIAGIYNPTTTTSDPFVTIFLNLDTFAGTNFEVCFQSINIFSKSSDPSVPLGSKGDNVYIDNIYFSEESTESIEEPQICQDREIIIYPNPNKGVFNLEYTSKQAESIKIEILDLLGKNLEQKNMSVVKGLNKITLDLKGQPKGIYVIKITSQSGILINRIIHQ
jgi:Zn-dependent metalloprotease